MSVKETVLVTGGAGYIGSHMNIELLQSGRNVVVLDNLCNANKASIAAVERITQKALTFVEGDIRDGTLLEQLFASHNISAVLHFAGLKSVGESTCSGVGRPPMVSWSKTTFSSSPSKKISESSFLGGVHGLSNKRFVGLLSCGDLFQILISGFVSKRQQMSNVFFYEFGIEF